MIDRGRAPHVWGARGDRRFRVSCRTRRHFSGDGKFLSPHTLFLVFNNTNPLIDLNRESSTRSCWKRRCPSWTAWRSLPLQASPMSPLSRRKLLLPPSQPPLKRRLISPSWRKNSLTVSWCLLPLLWWRRARRCSLLFFALAAESTASKVRVLTRFILPNTFLWLL